ncbi:uncharacterized protein LOC113219618 isoform X2 [Piliocolobus tephrosceles]|uniref:uncharacterized protein LOC113219618 isoform X2 n=1 Tax=Piliocolobus tephrosceles TaxID=591936 RepID=UPI000E6B1ACA|nr:uncharacterized protein LOC113219618 isoform X2 [Piliocolobus tephrosceles]
MAHSPSFHKPLLQERPELDRCPGRDPAYLAAASRGSPLLPVATAGGKKTLFRKKKGARVERNSMKHNEARTNHMSEAPGGTQGERPWAYNENLKDS